MYKGQNWMTEAVGSLHSALAKVGVVVEAGEVAATTLADSFSSHVCCSWTTWRNSRSTCLLRGTELEMMAATGCCRHDCFPPVSSHDCFPLVSLALAATSFWSEVLLAALLNITCVSGLKSNCNWLFWELALPLIRVVSSTVEIVC